MKQRLRSVSKRGASPLLAALDRRLQELAVRLERHTTNLAADQTRRLDQIEERVNLDLRVVDEQLLAMSRLAHQEPANGSFVATIDGAEVLVAPPGASLETATPGHRIERISSVALSEHGAWILVDRDDGPGTLRIARLAPNS